MKRIKVIGPVELRTKGGSLVFRPGTTYEVEDGAAEHPWLARHLVEKIDLGGAQVLEEPKKEVKRARSKRIQKSVSDVQP